MSVKIRIISALLLVAMCVTFCSCAVKLDPPRDVSSEDEAKNMGFSACEYTGSIAAGEYMYLDVNIKLDYEYAVNWSSSDTSIAVVDSGGRVDALKPGNVTITAHAKSASVDYDIQVTKAKNTPNTYSTAILKNYDKIKENKDGNIEKNLYAILVNELRNCVTVYTYDSTGGYTIPVRAMLCSTGEGGKTPNLDNVVGEKSDWVYLSDKMYYRYATYIGEDLMFQSVPYSKQSPDALVAEEFNNLGKSVTQKNIRLSVADAKWIYDNCGEGTQVKIVNDDNDRKYLALGLPEGMKLTENSKSLKWDPTDSTKKNPYVKMKPVINGVEDVVIGMDTGFDLLGGVTAVDTCGNDISSKVTVGGDFDRNREGRYVISYFVTDAMGRKARADRAITVVRDIEKHTATSAVAN